MKIKISLFYIIPALIAIIAFFYCSNNRTSSGILNINKVEYHIKKSPEEINAAGMKYRASYKYEKKDISREENEKKFDHPNKFVQFENSIRTPYGASSPNYPVNYKMIELNKAVERKFGVSLEALNRIPKKTQDTYLRWVERGPGNVSGRTRGLIVDPDDSTGNTWFAASVGGGVWKTTDAGTDWTDMTPDLPNLATSVIAMAPSNHNIIYLGTGEGFFNADAINGSGIFKSTDKGKTWTQLSSTASTLKFQNVNRIIVSPDNPNVLLACTNVSYNSEGLGFYSGIFKSSDGGSSWTKVYSNNQHRVQQLIANPENFNTIYAAVNTLGIIKSLNSGRTWDTTTGIVTNGRVEIAIAPTDTSRLYAGVESTNGSDLFMSENAGETWTLVNDSSGTNPDWFGGQGWYDNTLAVNPYYEDSLMVGGINLYKFAVVPGEDTIHSISSSTYNTSSFLSFVNWGGSFLNGGGGKGAEFLGGTAVTDTDYVSVKIKFGPGISQMAHRFVLNSSTSGFEYKDYVKVPFEVWDVTNNRQLMVSFYDWDSSGTFKLLPYDKSNLQREYIFISSITYDSSAPSPLIAATNGMIYKNIYVLWPILADSAAWEQDNLPLSSININYYETYAKLHSSLQITNWYTDAGYPYIHADQHNIIIIPGSKDPDSYRVLDTNDGGCAISYDDGISWNQITSYQTTQFYGVDKNPVADQYLGGMQDNGTWYSYNNPTADSHYKFVIGGDGFFVDWKNDDVKQLMGCTYNDEFYKSVNRGANWSEAQTGLKDVGDNAPFITELAKTNQDPDLIFTTGKSGVWRSDNFGDNWTLSPVPDSGYSSLMTPVCISLADPQIVWAGAYLDSKDRLEVSTDGGITFSPSGTNNVGDASELSGLATDPVHDSTAYALFSVSQAPKILKTTDLGKTWHDISGFGSGSSSSNGFPDVAAYCLLVMPNQPDTIWVGTEIGLIQSTDGGGTWQLAGNGLPAVSIWEMRIVGNEIVVATHGRGIWSVRPPWLNDYVLPSVTKSPRINYLAQGPDGMFTISFSLRSSYDSSTVYINGKGSLNFDVNNAVIDSVISLPVNSAGMDSVQVISYKSGVEYKSPVETYGVLEIRQARTSYSNNFNTATNDFYGTGFKIDTAQGFDNGAIQSSHPYDNNTDESYELTVPITVASSIADLSYDDVALVEPGDSGSAYGSNNFYDYVVVEGSADGYNWTQLAPGYDSRYSTAWLKAWDSNSNGDSSMFAHHDINLLDSFTGGQKILIRFRLYSDGSTNGWGWAIDNLNIQSKVTEASGDKKNLPESFSLSQNYPNPFNPSTMINFRLPERERVTLTVYNSLGQKVKTLLNGFRGAGYYRVAWDGTNNNGSKVASGIYLYRIAAGNFVNVKKMVLLK